MRYMKRLSVALIAVGLSAPAFANESIFVPSQHSGFKVSVDTLYLRENSINKTVDSNYGFGNDIQIGYLFPNTGNDLTVHYNMSSQDNSNASTDDKGVFVKGNQTSDLGIIDLEGGQRFCASSLDMRVFGGLRYMKLAHGFKVNSDFGDQSFDTKFSGVGPRFGTDARYNLGCGLGLDAHLNTALLVGKVNNSYEDKNLSTRSSEISRVVPQVEGKLGFDYTSAFCNKAALVFEIGYQTSNNFNVIDASMINSASDANFNGAYLDVKYYS
jgi:Legionella pneumophila major outer membrane protein precursor